MVGRIKALCPNIAADVGRNCNVFDSFENRMKLKNNPQKFKKIEGDMADNEDREEGEIVENASETHVEKSSTESTLTPNKPSAGIKKSTGD